MGENELILPDSTVDTLANKTVSFKFPRDKILYCLSLTALGVSIITLISVS